MSLLPKSAKKPPMSDPQVLTPESPIVSPFVTTERRPSNPQPTVGSPPHTIGEQRALPVHPERTKRARPRGDPATPAKAPQWYWRG